MDKIVPAFEVSLFDPTLSDACRDFVEAGIDSVLDGGILRSVPIVNVLVGLGKTAQNIHDRNLLRQTLKFINAFKSGNIEPEKLEKYRRKLAEDPQKAEAELGRVIILLNRNVDLRKSAILGRLYSACVRGDMSWEQFCELSDVTDRIFLQDVGILQAIREGRIDNTRNCAGYQAERLNSLGLVSLATQTMRFSSVDGFNTEKALALSELGKRFVEYAI